MQSFKTSDGQSWDVNITVLAARTIRARCGLSVYHLFDDVELHKLHDEMIFVDALWAVVEQQALSRGESFDSFFTSRMDSDALDLAGVAFLRAAVDAIPEKKRAEVRRKVEAMLRGTARNQANALERLAAIDDAAIEDAIANANLTKSALSSTSSAESSESTPTD